MQKELSSTAIGGILVVVLLVIGALAWTMFGPKSKPGSGPNAGTGDAATREAYFKDHPGARQVFEGMNKGGAPGSGGTPGSGGAPGGH